MEKTFPKKKLKNGQGYQIRGYFRFVHVRPDRKFGQQTETGQVLDQTRIPNKENSDLEIMFSAGQIEIIVRVKKEL